MAVTRHHARLGTQLRARLCCGLHFRRLNFMSFQGATPHGPRRADFPQRVLQDTVCPSSVAILLISVNMILAGSESCPCLLSADSCSCSPLPSSGSRGRPLREPCGSPPSSVLWVRTIARHPSAPPTVSRGCAYPRPCGGGPPGRKGMRSCPGFLANRCESMPRA